MSKERYYSTIEYTRENIVRDFINLNDDWFSSITNEFYNKRDICLKYLMYWVEKGEFGPDWDQRYLIYLENKFLEYFNNCFKKINAD